MAAVHFHSHQSDTDSKYFLSVAFCLLFVTKSHHFGRNDLSFFISFLSSPYVEYESFHFYTVFPVKQAAADFSSAEPCSLSRRGVRVAPQRDADSKDDRCVILCDKQTLFLAVEADAEGCQFSWCSAAGTTSASVESALQFSWRRGAVASCRLH